MSDSLVEIWTQVFTRPSADGGMVTMPDLYPKGTENIEDEIAPGPLVEFHGSWAYPCEGGDPHKPPLNTLFNCWIHPADLAKVADRIVAIGSVPEKERLNVEMIRKCDEHVKVMHAETSARNAKSDSLDARWNRLDLSPMKRVYWRTEFLTLHDTAPGGPAECAIPVSDLTEEEILDADSDDRLDELCGPMALAPRFFDGIANIGHANAARKRIVKDVLLQGVARGQAPDRAQAILARHALPSASQREGVDEEIFDAASAYQARRVGVATQAAEAITRGYLQAQGRSAPGAAR